MEDLPTSSSTDTPVGNSQSLPPLSSSPYFPFARPPSIWSVSPFGPLPTVPQFSPYGTPEVQPTPWATEAEFCNKSSTYRSSPKININTRLAAEILLSEASKVSSGKNVVCSPLSLEFAMHMVAAGTKGETLSQLLQFLGSKDYPLESMEDLSLKSSRIMKVAKITSSCYKSEKEPELSFANGVWIDRSNELKPSYKELMSSIYNARAETVNFKEQASQIVGDINSWVDDKTKGLIKDILKPGSINEYTRFILANALYFKGFWSKNNKFDEDMTVDKDFHLLNGRKVSVPFMSRRSPSYLHGEFDDYRVVQINYQRGNDELRQFCMQILLPNEKDGLQNLMNKCISDPSLLHQDLKLNNEKFREMRIPKFKFTYMPEDIVGMMKSLGLTLPFEEDCKDFTEMVKLQNGENIYVNKVIHKAKIEVNESSTEAAAATVIMGGFGCSMPPPRTSRFVADHPFMFLIKEVNSGAIFFMGAVLNPLLED